MCGAVSSRVQTRSIDFPAKGLGKFYINEKKEFLAQWPEFSERRWARGRVTVPADASITVETYWCTGDCLPDLRFLKASDIQGLDVDGSLITHDSFKPICKLSGLRNLILEGTDTGDRDIEVVSRRMPLLKELNLGYTRVTDLSLANVGKMRNLASLSLQRDKITTAGLARLGSPVVLSQLNLKETKIADSALDVVSKIKSLTELNIAKTKISDEGLTKLLKLRLLRKLDLSENSVTDKGLIESVSKMENLDELNLSGTKVTDAGVASLKSLKHLRKLWLRDLRTVSDASVPVLISLSEMQDLELQKTNITASAIQVLAKALPKSEIHSKALCKCHKQTRVN